MAHAVDFERLRDQHAQFSPLQRLDRESGGSAVALRLSRPADGVTRHPREALMASAPTVTNPANKNFHARVGLPASRAHSEPPYKACRTAETAPIDVLHLEWVVAEGSTNMIDAREVRVTGRIRQGRGCT
jgi:hypothetical protein